MNKETETKLELSREAATRLLEVCRIKRRDKQLNVYYDHNQRLAAAGATLRIRLRKGSKPMLTLKLPESHNGTMREMWEFHSELSAEHRVPPVARLTGELPESFRQPLRSLGVDSLRRVGWMRTERVGAELPSGIQVDLDKVRLPNHKIVFELEVESEDPGVHARTVAEVYSLVAGVRPSSVSKFQRFRAAKEQVSFRQRDATADPFVE